MEFSLCLLYHNSLPWLFGASGVCAGLLHFLCMLFIEQRVAYPAWRYWSHRFRRIITFKPHGPAFKITLVRCSENQCAFLSIQIRMTMDLEIHWSKRLVKEHQRDVGGFRGSSPRLRLIAMENKLVPSAAMLPSAPMGPQWTASTYCRRCSSPRTVIKIFDSSYGFLADNVVFFISTCEKNSLVYHFFFSHHLSDCR